MYFIDDYWRYDQKNGYSLDKNTLQPIKYTFYLYNNYLNR